MKNVGRFIVLALIANASTVFGQGYVKNTNYDPVNGVDAPCLCGEGPFRVGPGWVAQLYAGTDPGSLSPVGSLSPFGEGQRAGYWIAPESEVTSGVPVSDVDPGETVYVQYAAWSDAFATLPEAQAGSWSWIISEVVAVVAGDSGAPAPLLGLTSTLLLGGTCDGAVQWRGPIDIKMTWGNGPLVHVYEQNYQFSRSRDLLNWDLMEIAAGSSYRDSFPARASVGENKEYFQLRQVEDPIRDLASRWDTKGVRDYQFRFSGVSPIDFESRLDLSIVVRDERVSSVEGFMEVGGLFDESETIEVDSVEGFGGMTIPFIYQRLRNGLFRTDLSQVMIRPDSEFFFPSHIQYTGLENRWTEPTLELPTCFAGINEFSLIGE